MKCASPDALCTWCLLCLVLISPWHIVLRSLSSQHLRTWWAFPLSPPDRLWLFPLSRPLISLGRHKPRPVPPLLVPARLFWPVSILSLVSASRYRPIPNWGSGFITPPGQSLFLWLTILCQRVVPDKFSHFTPNAVLTGYLHSVAMPSTLKPGFVKLLKSLSYWHSPIFYLRCAITLFAHSVLPLTVWP